MAKRQAGRTSLLGFTTYTMPDYRIGRHHRLLCDRLEAVERGECKRLIVSMPPRHGKSELTSKRFPAWYVGRHPTRQVIISSYGATLAQSFGRDVRNIVASSTFRALFPDVGLASDSAARDRWHTTAGGAFTSMGVGGGLTGLGGSLIVCDDPLKDRQDADSETVRDGVWDWYRSVLRTRLMPGGAIVLVLTRWHPSDPAGRLIEDMEAGTGERWDVINLPAVANGPDELGRQAGEALWPEAYDIAELADIRASIGEREWAALFQGSPTIGEGGLFKTGLISALEAAPAEGKRVRRWDLAATSEVGTRDPDWTVGVLMNRTPESRFIIEDVVRLRGGPDEVEAAIVATAHRDGKGVQIGLPQDPGQSGKSQVLYLTKKLLGFRVQSERETGDKATRAAPFASQVNVGNVSVVQASWNRVVLEELTGFPSVVHDDCVDAASGAFSMLIAPPEPARFTYIPRMRN